MRRLLWCVCAFGLLLSVSRAELEEPNLIVTMRSDNQIAALNAENGTRTIGHIPQTSVYLLKSVSGEDSDRVLKKIRRNNAVDSVEMDIPLNLNSTDMTVAAY